MKKTLSLFLLLIFAHYFSIAQWQQTNGPCGGVINCFLTSGPDIFAGSVKGVFFSADTGKSWTSANSGLLNPDVFSLAIDDTNMYAGTYGGGIFKSTDYGNSWFVDTIGIGNQVVNVITISGATILAGTYGGVYISVNNGNSWATDTMNGMAHVSVNAIVVSGSNTFAGTNSGFYLSSDTGGSWTAMNNGLPPLSTYVHINSIALNGTTIFAGTNHGVFQSSDTAATWVPMNSGLTDTTVNDLMICGTNFFAATTSGIFLSVDSGNNWVEINNNLSRKTNVLSLTSLGPDVFAGCDLNGIYLSTDTGQNWFSVNKGLTFVDKVSALAPNDSLIFAGTAGEGIYVSSDNGDNWNEKNEGLMHFSIASFGINGANTFTGTYGGGIFLSTDNANSWSSVNNGFPGSSGVAVTCFAFNNTNTFAGSCHNYYNIYPGGILLSTNNGNYWTQVSNGLPLGSFWIYSLVNSGDTLFAGTNYGVFLSLDNGANWTSVNSGLQAQCLAIIDTNIYAGTRQNGVFLSSDNGANWTAMNNGLPVSPYFSVNSFATYGDNIFAGTESGVFLSSDNGSTWSAVNNGLTDTLVASLAISGSDIFAGTIYGGVWRRPLSEVITAVEIIKPPYFHCYPNPAIDHFTIRSSIKNGKVEIYNILGEKIYSEKLNSESIYLTELAGIYFVKVIDGERVFTQKLVIE